MRKKYALIMLLIVSFSGFAQKNDRQPKERPESTFKTDIPAHNYNLILSRPTDQSITISIFSYKNAEAYLVYFQKKSDKQNKTNILMLNANKPVETILGNLITNSQYSYYVIYKAEGEKDFTKSVTYSFHTQRTAADSFCFTLTADSHLDENADKQVYTNTLLNAASDSADFHVDLGDTFMTDKYRQDYKNAFNQYIAQRYYFSLLHSPLFLVLGNHDGESGQRLNGIDNNMTVWSNQNRKDFFPNPEPNGFYSGNSQSEKYVGLPQDYYSWTWGNALFIVLDPFLFTSRSGMDNPWDRTLGKTQYDWLKSTLENSKTIFKFVFIHNLVGGVDNKGKGRGGAEVAGLYEWGGKNPDGTDGFKTHRPDWKMPIHELLKKYHVNVVFHGHDHLFAKQEKDGIIYQCISQPGSMRTRASNQATEYGYLNKDIFLNPGYMRVSLQKNRALFEFVNTNNTDTSKNKKVIYNYELKK
ncbi:MAG: metallophosphoesterase [Paludibacter sp.]